MVALQLLSIPDNTGTIRFKMKNIDSGFISKTEIFF
jgi:hypothetical protein